MAVWDISPSLMSRLVIEHVACASLKCMRVGSYGVGVRMETTHSYTAIEVIRE